MRSGDAAPPSSPPPVAADAAPALRSSERRLAVLVDRRVETLFSIDVRELEPDADGAVRLTPPLVGVGRDAAAVVGASSSSGSIA